MRVRTELYDNENDELESFARLRQVDRKKARFRRQIEKRLEQKELHRKLRDVYDD